MPPDLDGGAGGPHVLPGSIRHLPMNPSTRQPARRRSLLTIIALAIALGGCADRIQPARAAGNTAHSWQAGKFTVSFQAGPKPFGAGPQRSFSYYVVTRKLLAYSGPASLAIESAHAAESFQRNPKSKPADFIRVFISASGNTLLIQEEIPNDCADCLNYIVVAVRGSEMTYEYLNLPSAPAEVEAEAARVISISDTDITFGYADGRTLTRPLKSVTKADQRPEFPG
jgi:hypothetical protein